MSFETVTLRKEGRVGLIGLNRPEVLNAINPQMKAEFAEALDRHMADEEVLVVVLHGSGRAFSAGFDLKAGEGAPTEGNLAWRARLRSSFDFIMQVWDAPKPSVAAVHGYCIAGAFELAMACDMIVAEAGTRFGEPEVRFGSGLVAMLLPWMTTPKFAAELMLTGEDRLDAERAERMGLVNRVVPQGEGLAAALALAGQMVAADPVAVRLTRDAMHRGMDIAGMRQALEAALETDVVIEGAVGPQREEFNRIRKAEGLKAALAWRDAQFRKP
ncbi:enoyl-CoA hydratase-related protein [Paralimibaculum aggregatum]|uniref:Enoyl-CoA hydratase-related protein n=1 Tax=Paralimibaculum aggregatum TaxID=3036245 RepID=A0ABQ6LSR9_9RHOB|nr:enoyl-CoA hydratase/isomerase family protein [Limibaculum sp. NKW23]GMG85127.1 enoyl-CoA hydratase-related protein [Limibaculum sp. NKW23]